MFLLILHFPIGNSVINTSRVKASLKSLSRRCETPPDLSIRQSLPHATVTLPRVRGSIKKLGEYARLHFRGDPCDVTFRRNGAPRFFSLLLPASHFQTLDTLNKSAAEASSFHLWFRVSATVIIPFPYLWPLPHLLALHLLSSPENRVGYSPVGRELIWLHRSPSIWGRRQRGWGDPPFKLTPSTKKERCGFRDLVLVSISWLPLESTSKSLLLTIWILWFENLSTRLDITSRRCNSACFNKLSWTNNYVGCLIIRGDVVYR